MSGRSLLLRGMLVGVTAGVLALAFGYLLGEPPLNQAIAFEGAMSDGAEPVSRAVQSTAGLATALLIFGTAIGGLYGIAFAVAYGRIGRFGARATAALVALGASFPPNSPSSSNTPPTRPLWATPTASATAPRCIS
jgi:hypothetical protein